MPMIDLETQLAALPGMTGRELRERWTALTDKPAPRVSPALLRLVSGRGVTIEPAKLGAMTVTSALRGLVRDDVRTRQEFLALTKRSSHEQ